MYVAKAQKVNWAFILLLTGNQKSQPVLKTRAPSFNNLSVLPEIGKRRYDCRPNGNYWID